MPKGSFYTLVEFDLWSDVVMLALIDQGSHLLSHNSHQADMKGVGLHSQHYITMASCSLMVRKPHPLQGWVGLQHLLSSVILVSAGLFHSHVSHFSSICDLTLGVLEYAITEAPPMSLIDSALAMGGSAEVSGAGSV